MADEDYNQASSLLQVLLCDLVDVRTKLCQLC